METAATAASELLRSMANRHRLLILCLLADRERPVGELAELTGIGQSTTSQHLAILRREGLVGTRREGQTIWYSLSSAPAASVIDALYQSFCSQTPAGRRAGRK